MDEDLLVSCVVGADGQAHYFPMTAEEKAAIEADWARPKRVPERISDVQFFMALAREGHITEAEAEASNAAVVPQTLLNAINSNLPENMRFEARMRIGGSTEFRRHHPLTAMLAQAMGWNDEQVDALWRTAAQI
jgi:hypothetical protein